jgi:drug/metabolite transporter (DMT)-like permease
MKKGNLLLVYAICLAAMVFWSFSFIWYKDVYKFFTPFATVLFRLTISSVLLFVISLAFKKLQPIQKKDWTKILLLAFFEPLLYFIGESQGMLYVSPTTASVVISIIPLIVPVLAYFLLNERLLVKNIIGIAISCFGVFLVVVNSNFEFVASVKGILLLLISVFAAVFYSVFLKKLADIYNPLTLIAWQNTIGAIMFLPLVIIFEPNSLKNIPISLDALTPLFKLAVFASSLAFVFYTYSVQKLGAVKANIFTNLIPVITAFFSFLLLGEKLYFHNVLGIFIVIGGLILSQLNPAEIVRNARDRINGNKK